MPMTYYRIARLAEVKEETHYLHENGITWLDDCNSGDIGLFVNQGDAVKVLSSVLNSASHKALSELWYCIEVSKSPKTFPIYWPTDDEYAKLEYE